MSKARTIPGIGPGPAILLTTIILACWLAPSAGVAAADGFTIEYAYTRPTGEGLVLEAKIDYRFSDEAMEALRKGVPLNIIIDVEIQAQRKWWPDKKVAGLQQKFRIERHALSSRYIVTDLETGDLRNFESVEEMLPRLGEINGLVLLQAGVGEQQHKLLGRMRTRLDIEALPAPLRPLAYLSRKWRLASGWYRWEITP